jgi:hypothetical protein
VFRGFLSSRSSKDLVGTAQADDWCTIKGVISLILQLEQGELTDKEGTQERHDHKEQHYQPNPFMPGTNNRNDSAHGYAEQYPGRSSGQRWVPNSP